MKGFPQFLDRYFHLAENNTDVVTEMRAGLTTFLTASYIIFVQPSVLSQAGMDFGAVMTATCISAALGYLIMGLWANYPIAVAPWNGHQFLFYLHGGDRSADPLADRFGRRFHFRSCSDSPYRFQVSRNSDQFHPRLFEKRNRRRYRNFYHLHRVCSGGG